MRADGERVVRTAVGAGRWFPGDRASLEANVVSCMGGGDGVPGGRIVSAIAPHAGYIYSAAIAGRVFGAIAGQAASGDVPDAVVLLGFSHRGAFPGLAVMDGYALETPLGEVRLDADTGAFLAARSERIFHDYLPHRGEHSAENQVPFLQRALPGVPLTIGLMGDHDGETLAAVVSALCALGRQKKLLVVASSDMLHDPDYELVSRTDRETLAMLESMDDAGLADAWSFDRQVLCGIQPVLAALQFAREQGCSRGTVLEYRNSGDDHPESRGDWVVGYGAVILAADPATPS